MPVHAHLWTAVQDNGRMNTSEQPRNPLHGKTLERKVQVKAGSSARVELVWPAGTNQSSS